MPLNLRKMASMSKMYMLEDRLDSLNNYFNMFSVSVNEILQSKVMEAYLKRQRMAAMSVVAKSQLMLAEMDVLIAENRVYEKMVQFASKRFKADKVDRRGYGSSSHRKSLESKSDRKSKKSTKSRFNKYKKDSNKKHSKSYKSFNKSSVSTQKSVKDFGCGPSDGSDVIMRDLTPKVTAKTEVTQTPVLNPGLSNYVGDQTISGSLPSLPISNLINLPPFKDLNFTNYQQFMNALDQKVSQAKLQAPEKFDLSPNNKQLADSLTLSKPHMGIVPNFINMESNIVTNKLQDIKKTRGFAPLPDTKTLMSPISSISSQDSQTPCEQNLYTDSSTIKINNKMNSRHFNSYLDNEDLIVNSPVTETNNVPDSHKTAVNLFKNFKKIMPLRDSQPKFVAPKIEEVFSIFDIDVEETTKNNASVSKYVDTNVCAPPRRALVTHADIFRTGNKKSKRQQRPRQHKHSK